MLRKRGVNMPLQVDDILVDNIQDFKAVVTITDVQDGVLNIREEELKLGGECIAERQEDIQERRL